MENNKFILGVEPIDYKSKKTNKQVIGCVVYVAQFIDNGTKCCGNIFVSDGKLEDFPLGAECDIYYNRFGTPCKVVIL